MFKRHTPQTHLNFLGKLKHDFVTAKRWIDAQSKSKPILLLHGPTSSGKTLLAQTLLRPFSKIEFNGFVSPAIAPKLFELTQSLTHNEHNLHTMLGVTNTKSVQAVLIEDIEACDTNTVRAVHSFATNNPKIHVVCVSTNMPVDRSFTNASMVVRTCKPPQSEIVGWTRTVCSKENIDIDPAAFTAYHNYDMRQILINLAFERRGLKGCPCDAQPPASTLEQLKLMFQSKHFPSSSGIFPALIHENYTKSSKKDIASLCTAAQALSDADLFSHSENAEMRVFMEVERPCRTVGASLSSQPTNTGLQVSLSPALDKGATVRMAKQIIEGEQLPIEHAAAVIRSLGFESYAKWCLAVNRYCLCNEQLPANKKNVRQNPRYTAKLSAAVQSLSQ